MVLKLTFIEGATIFALIAGPIAAVFTTVFIDRLRERRRERVWVFRTLMAFRGDKFNADRIRALAMIDLDFRGSLEVRAKWKCYYDSLINPANKDGGPDAVIAWKVNENAMLSEMAETLGYGRNIKYEELERTYSPRLYSDNAVLAQESGAEFLRVLKASKHFGAPLSEPDGG